MRFLLGFLFLLGPATGRAENIPHQYIVTFSTVAAARAFKPPRAFKKVDAYKVYLVLLAVSGDEEKEIEKLKKLPDVKDVHLDHLLHSASDVVSAAGINPANGSSVCSLGKFCPAVHRDLDWDEQLSNLDLMNKEVERLKLNPSLVKMAFVDSGVMAGVAEALSPQGTVLVAKGYNSTDLAEDRHGSKIVQRLIWAAPGSSVTSYGIYNSKGEADAVKTLRAIEDACKDGNAIINMSAHGYEKDQKGRKWPVPLEQTDTIFHDLPERLCRSGCMVLTAAGNLPKANNKGEILAIGALDDQGIPAGNYSMGHLMAGGVETTAYASGAGVARTADGCSTDLKYLSGTSEAVPLVAAIAKQTLTVLSQSRTFGGLSNCAKMKILDSIVRKSATAESANGEYKRIDFKKADGYRAVILAEQVTRDLDAGGKPTIDDNYVKDAYAKALAASPALDKKCNTIDGCDSKRACYQAERSRVALSGGAPSGNTVENLKDLYLSTKADPTLQKYWQKRLLDAGARSWLSGMGSNLSH